MGEGDALEFGEFPEAPMAYDTKYYLKEAIFLNPFNCQEIEILYLASS